jgi:hypothetical protein
MFSSNLAQGYDISGLTATRILRFIRRAVAASARADGAWRSPDLADYGQNKSLATKIQTRAAELWAAETGWTASSAADGELSR